MLSHWTGLELYTWQKEPSHGPDEIPITVSSKFCKKVERTGIAAVHRPAGAGGVRKGYKLIAKENKK